MAAVLQTSVVPAPTGRDVGHWPEALRRLAPFLVPSDLVLVEICLVRGLTYREAGSVLGMGAGSAHRRARRLKRLARCEEVAQLLAHGRALGEQTQRLALRHLVGGEHLVVLAPQFGISVRTARRMLERARLWVHARDAGAKAAARILLEHEFVREAPDHDARLGPSVVRSRQLAFGERR